MEKSYGDYLELLKHETTKGNSSSAAAVPRRKVKPQQPSRKAIQKTIQKYMHLAQREGGTQKIMRDLREHVIPPADLAQLTVALARELRPVEILKIGGFDLRDVGCCILARALGQPGTVTTTPGVGRDSIPVLEILDLGFNAIGDRGAQEIAQYILRDNALPHLKRLYLSGNVIQLDGITALAQSLCGNSCLEQFYFSGNQGLGIEGAKVLAEAVRSPKSALQSLYIGSNHLGTEGVLTFVKHLDDTHAARTTSHVSHDLPEQEQTSMNKKIKTHHHHQSDTRPGEHGPPPDIFSPDQKNPSVVHLKELMLGQNQIGARGIEVLAASLTGPLRGLRTLELGSNDIGDDSVRYLASALEPQLDPQRESGLEQLYLDHNPIQDGGATALGVMLSRNARLRILDLSFTALSLQGFRGLATGVRENPHTLTSLCLEGALVLHHRTHARSLSSRNPTSNTNLISPTNVVGRLEIQAEEQKKMAARLFAAAILSSSYTLCLEKLTGVRLYYAAEEMGLPVDYHDPSCSNEFIFQGIQKYLQGQPSLQGQGSRPRVTETTKPTSTTPTHLSSFSTTTTTTPRSNSSIELVRVQCIAQARLELENIQRLPYSEEERGLLEQYYQCTTPMTSPKRDDVKSSGYWLSTYARVEARYSRLVTKWAGQLSDKETRYKEESLTLLRQLHYLVHVLADLTDADAVIDTMLG